MRQLIYDLVGRLGFARPPDWEPRRSAKTLGLTVAFSLALGLVLAEGLRLLYQHRK